MSRDGSDEKTEQKDNESKAGFKERSVSKLLPLAEKIKHFFPNLKKEMLQAEIKDKSDTEFLAEQIFSALRLALYTLVGLFAVGIIFEDPQFYRYAALSFPVILLFGTFTFAKKPKAQVNKRMRKIEKELPYAMRHILVEVQSGIPLYQAMVSVTKGYGEVSEEFQKIVSEINAGKDEVKALENAVLRNPSQQFRRGIWQIINAIRSGSDISNALESLVDSLIENQVLEVEEYGEELNPYTLMYMLAAIITPSLGVTFFMMLTTFTGAEVGNNVFYIVLAGLVVFQVFFINLISTKRPQVKT